MKHDIDSKWLDKGQVCQRLGGINYTTLDYLISENNFPQKGISTEGKDMTLKATS